MFIFRGIVFVIILAHAAGIKIGAFNIRSFGRTKFAKQDVMTCIDKILRRYDIVLVQEIVDGQSVVIPGMVQRLRSYGEAWDVRNSTRLGTSTYKEQYAYFYRTDKVTVASTYQYTSYKDFARPPFGVLVNSANTGDLKQFGLLGVHISPYAAVKEVDALVKVLAAAKLQWSTDDIMVMGDFNAGGQYMSQDDIDNLALRKDTSYQWLIGDNECTTVSPSSCYAYDRMVLTGDTFKKVVDASSAQAFKYDSSLGLNQTMALAVSDHYPVEVDINPNTISTSILTFARSFVARVLSSWDFFTSYLMRD